MSNPYPCQECYKKTCDVVRNYGISVDNAHLFYDGFHETHEEN